MLTSSGWEMSLKASGEALAVQEFWAWMTATQLVRASAAPAGDATHARQLRRRPGSGPVTSDQLSFTAITLFAPDTT
jgi:hypothetical protein